MDPVKGNQHAAPHGPQPVSLNCPICHHDGIFAGFQNVTDIPDADGKFMLGQRLCPNPACSAHVFVVITAAGGRLVAAYPPASIPFDRESIPDKVLKAFDEAIQCHANQCWIASAIMIRKTLEEICKDKNATGNNLQERIKAMGKLVILPSEFLDAMHDIRLLGNDGAHVESQTYDDVSQKEVTIGIEVAKELLHAVYQYASIMGKLKDLQKPNPTPGQPTA